MKIEFLQAWVGERFAYRRGDVADLPRNIARSLINGGAARRMRAGAPENMMVAPPENAAAVTKPAGRLARAAAGVRNLIA